MPRNRSIQYGIRLQEIATAITYASCEVGVLFQQVRDCETKAENLKSRIDEEQKKLTGLLALQAQLIQTSTWSEFGLPPEITPSDFIAITGIQIKS